MKIKILKTVIGLAIFIFLLSFSARRHACKEISDFKIEIDHSENNRFISTDMVKEILDGKDLNVSKVPLGNLDIYKIEQVIASNPFVKRADVFCDIDGTMNVEAIQKTPVMRISNGADEFYLSDELSRIPLSKSYSAEVLIASGKIETEDFEGLKQLSESISDDKLLKKHIIAVKKEAPNSFNLLVNKGDYIIEFGELEDFEEKFEKLKLFYNEYLGKVGMNYYTKINLKFSNQIVATKRNHDE